MSDAELIQGSPEWLQARLGHVTASRFKDVLAKVKSGEAASRRNYRVELAVQRLTGQIAESYTNGAMQWGTQTEPDAREAYSFATDSQVEQCGFLHHPDLKWVGCSVDGLVGDEGGIEVKCPFQSAVHVDTLLGGVPPEHIPQIQGAMWVTGRKWWDFVSFDPRMPTNCQLFIKRVYRDEPYIQELASAVAQFLDELNDLTEKLRRYA
jgi:putative phage-type endonuclease